MHTIIYPGGFCQSGGYYSQLTEVESGPCQGNRLRQPPGVAASSAIPHLHPATPSLPQPSRRRTQLTRFTSRGLRGSQFTFPQPFWYTSTKCFGRITSTFLALISLQSQNTVPGCEQGGKRSHAPKPHPPATSQVRGLRPDASRIRAPKPGVKRAHPPPGRILCVTATTLAAGRWRPALRYSDIFARLGRATGQAGKRHTWTCGPRSGQNQWHACVIAERLADEYAQNSGDLMGRGVRPPGGEFLRYHGDEKGPVGIEAARDMAGVLSRSIPVCTYKFCIVVGMHSTYTPGE